MWRLFLVFIIPLFPSFVQASEAGESRESCSFDLIDVDRAIDVIGKLEFRSSRFQERVLRLAKEKDALFSDDAKGLAHYLLIKDDPEGSTDTIVQQPFQFWLIKTVEDDSFIRFKIPVIAALDPTNGRPIDSGERNSSEVNVLNTILGGMLLFVATLLNRDPTLQRVDVELAEIINPALQRQMRIYGLSIDEEATAACRRDNAQVFTIQLTRP